MKKFSAFALCLLITPMLASAIPMSWNDSINFNNLHIGSGESKSFTHNINTDGFNAGSDRVESYRLSVGIRDDNDRRWEGVYLDQPGILGDRATLFSAQDITAGWSFRGRAMLNASGLLNVSVDSIYGDFILQSSRLWAGGYGDSNSTNVPEPGSLALLGLGLIGLGVARRRLNPKS